MKQLWLNSYIRILVASILFSFLASCSPNSRISTPKNNAMDRPNIVATTTIVADIVRNVAGERVNLHVLVPPGVDEHSFQYTPEDAVRVADADLIFMNGAGLETFMASLLKNIGTEPEIISISDGVALLKGAPETHPGESESGEGDPHVWTNPENVKTWTRNIAAALADYDHAHATEYQANAQKYQQSLDNLDAWIQEQVSRIPQENRSLISDHQVFTYFANRYGFEMTGALIPSYSTVAEPTAQELASLEDAIRRLGIKAIFVGNTINPTLAERVAADTGVRLVRIYTGSLTSGPPAATYLDYMKTNVNSIVDALR